MYWVTPNLIGFQFVMHGIKDRLVRNGLRESRIVVDQQSQFNKTQKSLAEFCAKAKGFKHSLGPGLPDVDYGGMPTAPIEFLSSKRSAGLELVDIYLWIFKRIMEDKQVSAELAPLVKHQFRKGRSDEVSLSALSKRWTSWFDNLPEPTPEAAEKAQELMRLQEERRHAAMNGANEPNHSLQARLP